MYIRYLIASLLVAAATLTLWLLRDVLTLANFALVYVLVTLIIAVWLGTGPSLLAVAVSFISFNFFLIRPLYTLIIEDPRELIDLFVFLLVAVIAGQLAAYARRQANAARLYAVEQNILYSLSSTFNQLTDREAIHAALESVARESLAVTKLAILPGANRQLESVTGTTAYVVLSAGDAAYGVVEATFPSLPSESQIRILTTAVTQAAMALQRVELNEDAQRSHSLAEADKLKTALLHAVSHDLRTPLTIIKTSASSLQALYGRLTPEQQLEMVKTIDSEADRLNQLVGNLLDMSRLKAGAMVLNKQWNALAEIAGDVAAQVYERQQAERVRLLFADDMPLAQCDYGLILQVLTNIVDNALRYEPAASQVEIHGAGTDAEVQVKVINHGPVIPDEEKAHIMEPFYHGPDGQVGLGLAISQGIIELHHGRLWVEDTPGTGATFIFTLPLHELAQEGDPHVAAGRG